MSLGVVGAYGVRDLLAVGLVGVLGTASLVRPDVMLRLLVLTHGPDTGRRGPYGGEPEYSDRARWGARAAGALSLALGAAILIQPYV